MRDSIHDYNARLPTLIVLEALEMRESVLTQRYWRGHCPWHKSTSRVPRAFRVNMSNNMYLCERCQVWGSLVQLWSLVRNISISETLREMRERFP